MQQSKADPRAEPTADDASELIALERAGEIPLQHIRQALKDRGYRHGFADGDLGPITRDSILRFQDAMGYPKIGEFDTRQRILLIETAAIAGHTWSQNTFDIMAAEAIGIPMDLKRAAHWLQVAAQ